MSLISCIATKRQLDLCFTQTYVTHHKLGRFNEIGSHIAHMSVNEINYRTQSANDASIQRAWLLVDAADQVLGRLASQVATLIRGKHKPNFTPHINGGDKVVVINADKVRLTSNKWSKKQYVSHTGYPGGQKKATPQQVKERFPVRIIEHAVKGMLPKNKLGRKLFHNLFVYAGSAHDHAAQKPKKITLR